MMQQDDNTLKLKLDTFVKTICKSKILYGLESEEGFAISGSVDYDDENGEPVEVICFWSEEALAAACTKEDWANYQVVEIPLAEFMENWCIEMNNDGLLAGIDFDENLSGLEIEPLDLVMELIKELKSSNKSIAFESYESLADLEKHIREANS
jgi:hypothetical protein